MKERQLERVVHFELLVGVEHLAEIFQHDVGMSTVSTPFPRLQRRSGDDLKPRKRTRGRSH